MSNQVPPVSELFPGYVGELKDGLPNNYGCITFPNGNRYEGQWQNGKRTGTGRYFYSNGSKYEGEVLDGHLHGTGVLTFANGNHYKGTKIYFKHINGVFIQIVTNNRFTILLS